jgi:hypothetical protein
LCLDFCHTGTTAVYFAAQEGRLECLQYLVREAGADPLAKARDGMTSVHAATQGGHLDTVRWLIKTLGQEKMSEPSEEDGATPVHYAAATGHYYILKWFLETNGSHLVHLRDAYGGTPGHDAAEYNHYECLKLLLEHGADLYALDQEGMSPYSLAIRNIESETAEFVMDYAQNSPAKQGQTEQDTTGKARHTSQQNREMESSDDEEIKLPRQDRRLSQTSMPRTLADDAFEITEARKEVEMALQSGSGEESTEPAGLKERHRSRLGATDNAHQSGSELDLVFSIEDHEPGQGMPNTAGVLKVDSNGMLKMSVPEHYEGPKGGLYAQPQHIRKQKKAKSKSKLAEMDGIDDKYVQEGENTGQKLHSRKVSGPHYAEPIIGSRQPSGQRVYPNKLPASVPHYSEPIVVVHQPGEPSSRGTENRHPDYDSVERSAPTRVPPGSRRPPYAGYHPPQSRLLIHQQRMYESQHVNPWQSVGYRRLPPQGQYPGYRGVGPFDHEADIILIPRVIQRYPRLRAHDQLQFYPHSVAHQRHSPSPSGSPEKQSPRRESSNTKFTTLPAHMDYSRRPYDRMSHYQRAHPGYNPPAKSDGQHLRHRPNDKLSTGNVSDYPTPKTRRKNHIPSPIPVSDSDDVLFQHTRVGDPQTRPHSAVIPYYEPKRMYSIPRSGYPQNGPVFDPYRAQSMSALDSSLDHRLVKQREFSSHNELTARNRMYQDDMDDSYDVSKALAYAAVVVLAAIAGIPYKQKGPMMILRQGPPMYRQMNAVVPSRAPVRMIAEPFDTRDSSAHSKGQQAGHWRQEDKMTKGRKGKATEKTTREKKKSPKSKKSGPKTSHSSLASSLKPVPEDEFEYNYEMERNTGVHWTEEENTEEPAGKENAGNAHRVSGKDISEAYKSSKKSAWATMPFSPSAPTLLTNQATSHVSPADTRQFKVWTGQPQHPVSSSVAQIYSRQPAVSLSSKSRPEAGESEDNLDVWWSTTTASGYSYPKHPSLVPAETTMSHHHTSASTHTHHNTIIDYHVASTQPKFKPLDETSASVPHHGVVGVRGIHVGRESATHFSTVEATSSSRPRTAEAQASVVVMGPPPAPPVPSHLVGSDTGITETRMIRQASPPTAKVLTGTGTALEPVEEERLQNVGIRSASKRSTKRTSSGLDDYLGSMTSAHIKDELSKKEAELMQLQSLHRSFSKRGHEDEEDNEMMSEPTSIGGRPVKQDEAMLMRQESLRQKTVSSASHVQQLDRELQELKMLVPGRDDFMTPQGSQPTSPDSSMEKGLYMTSGSTSPMHQDAGQRALLQTVGKSPGAEEGQDRFTSWSVSMDDSPKMVHSGSSYSGMYYPFDGSEGDNSYKRGAIGPSVLAEKLKMAKATEGRNEAVADVVVKQTGQKGSLLQVPSTLNRQVVAAGQLQQCDGTVAMKAQAIGLGTKTDGLLKEPAKLTPVLPRKMAVLVRDETFTKPSNAEHSDNEDDYTYVSVTGNKIESKEAVLVHEREIPENNRHQVSFPSPKDDEGSMSSISDDTFIAYEGGKHTSTHSTDKANDLDHSIGSAPETPRREVLV